MILWDSKLFSVTTDSNDSLITLSRIVRKKEEYLRHDRFLWLLLLPAWFSFLLKKYQGFHCQFRNERSRWQEMYPFLFIWFLFLWNQGSHAQHVLFGLSSFALLVSAKRNSTLVSCSFTSILFCSDVSVAWTKRVAQNDNENRDEVSSISCLFFFTLMFLQGFTHFLCQLSLLVKNCLQA